MEPNRPRTERDFAWEAGQQSKPPDTTEAQKQDIIPRAIRLARGADDAVPPTVAEEPAEEFAALEDDTQLPELDDPPEVDMSADRSAESMDDRLLAFEATTLDVANAPSASDQGFWGDALPALPHDPLIDVSPSSRVGDYASEMIAELKGPGNERVPIPERRFFPGADEPLREPFNRDFRSSNSDPVDAWQSVIDAGSFSPDSGFSPRRRIDRQPFRILPLGPEDSAPGKIEELPYIPGQNQSHPPIQLLAQRVPGSDETDNQGSLFPPQPQGAAATRADDDGPSVTRPILLMTLFDMDAIVDKELEKSAKRMEAVAREVVLYEIETLEYERRAQMRALR